MTNETVYIQNNKTIYDHQTYLLGAYFDRYETASGAKVDRTWHQEGDLTGDSALKNVRPIPYTPILLHDDKRPRLWGSVK